jgi:hypothetical protein
MTFLNSSGGKKSAAASRLPRFGGTTRNGMMGNSGESSGKRTPHYACSNRRISSVAHAEKSKPRFFTALGRLNLQMKHNDP